MSCISPEQNDRIKNVRNRTGVSGSGQRAGPFSIERNEKSAPKSAFFIFPLCLCADAPLPLLFYLRSSILFASLFPLASRR